MKAYHQCTDMELMELLALTDEAAFREIYLRYDTLLYTYAFRKLQDKEEAKDVVQEIFINLWNQRKTFVLQTALSAYLYKSVLNKVFNIFKHKNIVQQYISANNSYIETGESETDYLIREKDITALIEKEIAAMPPRMREVYELKRKSFLSTKEIAEKLNISELTVSTQMKKAVKILKTKLSFIVYLSYILCRFL